jgi:hypothetical protein
MIEDLNGIGAAGPWEAIPGIYTLHQGKVDGNTVTSLGDSLVLKGFINTTTGEVKTYLAKLLDEKEAETLP